MSITIFYKGNLKQPNDLSDFFSTAIQVVSKYNWSYTYDHNNTMLGIDIPNCETLLFRPENGKISGFTKYCGEDQETLQHFFEILREIKPYFKRFDVKDDFGLWNDYISQFSKNSSPPFRELKDIEKAEFIRCFDLPKGSNSIFGMNQAQAVLMAMICKDMNRDLSQPIFLKDLLVLVDSRCKPVIGAEDKCFQFIAIVETWFLTKLIDKNGNTLKGGKEKVYEHTIFGWLMAEIIFGFGGGSLGSKHQKLHRFVDNIFKQNVDFSNPENFLRLIYSVIEYLGGFRPDISITRGCEGKI